MAAAPERFRLGVNYWPSETAMDWLARYDPAVVRRDFTRIAAAGMDTLRIFLRWEDLQPDLTRIDASALAAVVDAADAADDAAVELIVTLFTGHMSGVNWIPPWATGGDEGDDRFRVVSGGAVQPRRRSLRNWYADADITDAQAHLAESVASALSGHPALWAWDLGNENSNCTIPPGPTDADRWLERMTSVLRTHDPRVQITLGTHMEDLENERVIGPAQAARWCDFVCMHGYPVYAGWSTGATDQHLVPFLAEITRWLAADTPVLFAEFGQSTVPRGKTPTKLQLGEDEAAIYSGVTLDALRECGSIGALLWCYADYSSELHDTPPLDLAVHERTFGLWRADGTAKPAVAEIGARRGRPCCSSTGTRPWLDISVDEFTSNRRHQLTRLYRRYRQAAGTC
jgi:endo-1,4-beta-mannosidase